MSLCLTKKVDGGRETGLLHEMGKEEWTGNKNAGECGAVESGLGSTFWVDKALRSGRGDPRRSEVMLFSKRGCGAAARYMK
jgi:hypothetical protein